MFSEARSHFLNATYASMPEQPAGILEDELGILGSTLQGAVGVGFCFKKQEKEHNMYSDLQAHLKNELTYDVSRPQQKCLSEMPTPV